jgi:hypothetical protein
MRLISTSPGRPPTQVPPGDLGDAVGDNDESEFNDDDAEELDDDDEKGSQYRDDDEE